MRLKDISYIPIAAFGLECIAWLLEYVNFARDLIRI